MSSLDVFHEAVEAGFPELTIVLEPVVCIAHRVGAQPADAPARVDFALDQPRIGQYSQVLRDGGPGNVERAGEFTDGRRALGQPREDCAAGRVGQGSENGGQGFGLCYLI